MALTRPRYSSIVDSDFKNSCRTVTTTSVTLSGGAPSTYDSLTLAVGDRLLVTAQGSSAQNGIYIITTLGTGSNGTWTRSPDANDSSKLNAGMQVTVGEGTYAGQQFKLTTPDPINLGTTGLTFIRLAGAAAGDAGQLQYNLGGSIAGIANITVGTNGNLTITSNVVLSGNLWQGDRPGHGIAYTTKSATPPASAIEGDYWYDTSTDTRYIYQSDGVSSFWLDETTAPRSGYSFSNTPPISPVVGDQWYDTSTDIIYERITDGTSTYWVDLTTRLGAVSGATVNSNLVAAATTTSTSTTTGALVVKGGAGIAGNVYVGGNLTITSNLSVTQSGLFCGPYDENSILSGVFIGNTGTAPGITPRVGFFNGNTQQNWQIDNNAGAFRWFVPGAAKMTLYDTGNLNVTGSYTIGGKKAVNGPAFSAYASAVGQTITSGSQQKVLFQTEEFDTDNCYASSRFTPTVEGYYQLNAEVRLDGSSGTGEIMIVIWKNGAEYKRGTNQSGTSIATNFWAMTVSSLVYANGTTDYFEIYVQQTSGSSVTVTAVNSSNITWFNGAMVRGA